MAKETRQDIRRTLLFLIRDDEILVAMKKRGFGSGKWNGVGGKLESGESVEQALIRETEEEIEVTPQNYWQVAELDFVQDAETTDPWHMYVYAYFCDKWAGDPTESEEMAPRWFDVNALPYADMWDDDEFWIPRVLNGEKIVGNFRFDVNDRLINHSIKATERLPHQDGSVVS